MRVAAKRKFEVSSSQLCFLRPKLRSVEGAFLVEPDVADQQNSQKNEDGHQSERSGVRCEQKPIRNRPNKEKDGSDVEDHEEHSEDEKARWIAAGHVAFSGKAPFVRRKFRGADWIVTNQLEDQEGYSRERDNEQGVDQKRYVGGRHDYADASTTEAERRGADTPGIEQK